MSDKLTIATDAAQLTVVNDWIQDLAQSYGFSPKETFNLELVLEEAVFNVMKYAHVEPGKKIELAAEVGGGELRLIISDDGQPFDPTTAVEPEAPSNLDEAQIGGLGIHLIRRLMDRVEYARRDGRNILTLTKALG